MTDDDPYYRISLNGIARASLRELLVRAAAVGRSTELRATIRKALLWLQADPETVGEPVIDLDHLKVTLFTGVVDGLIVRYAIHFESRQVFINRRFDLSRWLGY